MNRVLDRHCEASMESIKVTVLDYVDDDVIFAESGIAHEALYEGMEPPTLKVSGVEDQYPMSNDEAVRSVHTFR